jgi:hypothetical protein
MRGTYRASAPNIHKKFKAGLRGFAQKSHKFAIKITDKRYEV